ncbi:rhomboid family intramembrane serine protease [Jiella sp. MQZ9-1]|uniref:rhomboid family intramembrane serine protease n=1 Tax=Jiella flava TaxID=2816857 RepID=UPI0031B7EB51|nr:rhomboid family intramembrane serine protease [Jiella flava]
MAQEELSSDNDIRREPSRRPPAINVPGVILALIAVMGLVHLYRTSLGDLAGVRFLVDFAFIPGCYGSAIPDCLARSPGADLWSPLTYAFLHGDWTHFGVNTVWFLAFGTPVARRLGNIGFLMFTAVGALAGAAVFYAFNPNLLEPVIGASGAVSALMGGACRFAFVRRAPFGGFDAGANAPCMPIGEALRERTVLVFALVFFGTNFLLGTSLGGAFTGGAQVAWEAHLGGFVFGFLGLPLFDRRVTPHR